MCQNHLQRSLPPLSVLASRQTPHASRSLCDCVRPIWWSRLRYGDCRKAWRGFRCGGCSRPNIPRRWGRGSEYRPLERSGHLLRRVEGANGCTRCQVVIPLTAQHTRPGEYGCNRCQDGYQDRRPYQEQRDKFANPNRDLAEHVDDHRAYRREEDQLRYGVQPFGAKADWTFDDAIDAVSVQL